MKRQREEKKTKSTKKARLVKTPFRIVAHNPTKFDLRDVKKADEFLAHLKEHGYAVVSKVCSFKKRAQNIDFLLCVGMHFSDRDQRFKRFEIGSRR